MIAFINHEFNSKCNMKKLSNNEFIFAPRVKMSYMTFKNLICKIWKISSNDIWIFDCWSYVCLFVISWNWGFQIRIWFREYILTKFTRMLFVIIFFIINKTPFYCTIFDPINGVNFIWMVPPRRIELRINPYHGSVIPLNYGGDELIILNTIINIKY